MKKGTKEFDDFIRTARFAVYPRVSSERQKNEGTIESQLDDIFTYLAKNYPWVKREDVIVYKDDGWTGTSLERPGMDNLRADLRDDKWDVLICYDQDRIARDPYLQLIVLEEIEKFGKILDFCTTEAPSQDEDSRMMFEFRGVMTKYERVRSLGRFRIGKLRKARSNKVLLSIPPYGYDLIKKSADLATGVLTDTHLVINDYEAGIVRDIFSWLADEGMTLSKIALRLTSMGIKPRRNKLGIWNTSTLSNLIRNSTYIGIARYQTTQAVEPKKKLKNISGPVKNKRTSKAMRPVEDWIEITVPAILNTPAERDLFERAQKQLVKNAAISPRKRKNEYLLGGLIYCDCGLARTGEGPKNGRYLYYRCGCRSGNKRVSRTCNQAGVDARIVDTVVWDKLQTIITNTNILRDSYELYRAKQGSSEQRQIDQARLELSVTEKQMNELKDAFVNNIITVNDFAKLKQDLVKKYEVLQEKVTELQSKIGNNQEVIPEVDFDEVVGIAKKLLKDLRFEEKRGIVVRLIDNIVAIPGTLDVTGYIGVSTQSTENILINQTVYSSNSSENHVKLKTISRYCRIAERW